MGTHLYALRKPNIQLGKRRYNEKKYIDSYQILSEWLDSGKR